MLFDLKQAPNAEKIVQQAIARRIAPPRVYANAPKPYPWLEVFYRAFWQLCQDRHYPGGPIPWTARQAWADHHRLDPVATTLLHTHIRELDIAFMEWMRDNATKGPSGRG